MYRSNTDLMESGKEILSHINGLLEVLGSDIDVHGQGKLVLRSVLYVVASRLSRVSVVCIRQGERREV